MAKTARAKAEDGSRPAASPKRAPRKRHSVYVVYLRNPKGDGKAGYYVGMTGLSPQQRFENHKKGIKCARVVRDFGVELAYEWFDEIPPMTYEDAALCEPTLADELRDRGFVVFGPTNRPRPTRSRRLTHKCEGAP